MHKNATKCNETLSKWCKNKHGASKIMDTLETYHPLAGTPSQLLQHESGVQLTTVPPGACCGRNLLQNAVAEGNLPNNVVAGNSAAPTPLA
jgi:hypothetical protein